MSARSPWAALTVAVGLLLFATVSIVWLGIPLGLLTLGYAGWCWKENQLHSEVTHSAIKWSVGIGLFLIVMAGKQIYRGNPGTRPTATAGQINQAFSQDEDTDASKGDSCAAAWKMALRPRCVAVLEIATRMGDGVAELNNAAMAIEATQSTCPGRSRNLDGTEAGNEIIRQWTNSGELLRATLQDIHNACETEIDRQYSSSPFP